MTDARADFMGAVHEAVHQHFEQTYPGMIQGERGNQRIVFYGFPDLAIPPLPRWWPHWTIGCPQAEEAP